MKDNKSLLNWMIALSVFVIWGNIASLFLSGEQYDAVIKLIDFVSLLFAIVVLFSAVRGKGRTSGKEERRVRRTERLKADPQTGRMITVFRHQAFKNGG